MKIVRILCLHFARQDDQDGQDGKNREKNHASKVTKMPKTKKTKICDERNNYLTMKLNFQIIRFYYKTLNGLKCTCNFTKYINYFIK